MNAGSPAHQKHISDRYHQIYLERYLDTAKEKYKGLIRSLAAYTESIDTLPDTFVAHICPIMVGHAVYSYFIDIIAFKEHHYMDQDELLNRPKVAAFTAKWVLQSKPISIKIPKNHKCSEIETSQITLIHELFCVAHICEVIEHPRDELHPNMADDLVYYMMTHGFDEMLFNMCLVNLKS